LPAEHWQAGQSLQSDSPLILSRSNCRRAKQKLDLWPPLPSKFMSSTALEAYTKDPLACFLVIPSLEAPSFWYTRQQRSKYIGTWVNEKGPMIRKSLKYGRLGWQEWLPGGRSPSFTVQSSTQKYKNSSKSPTKKVR